MKSGRRLSAWAWVVALAALAPLTWMFLKAPPEAPRTAEESTIPDRTHAPTPRTPTAAERLLEGYADPATPPIEDLRKIHRVAAGYFSVVKDASRFPIGGNADLSAALRGENSNREVLVPEGHRAFSKEGWLIDRWGTPLVVHPEGWKQLELRSAGPDKTPYTPDDLVLKPSGAASK
ncbi:hypothetical protein OKA05_13035 [Luteolibacter arcticus]|uniref:Uncharacterized protein n=1 Tax=Luteolibacter arcticus TaxID=1581411 RepID=A0ABT3GIZ8_9BACT|nr:hypothetical protein [Luteolibacter arcticus]MCW1923482.1 hypothetical protein [Luteolibacter arcticus]